MKHIVMRARLPNMTLSHQEMTSIVTRETYSKARCGDQLCSDLRWAYVVMGFGRWSHINMRLLHIPYLFFLPPGKESPSQCMIFSFFALNISCPFNFNVSFFFLQPFLPISPLPFTQHPTPTLKWLKLSKTVLNKLFSTICIGHKQRK